MDVTLLTPQRPVVVIGAAFGDVMLEVNALPHSGDDISALPLGQQIGGCAFNVARALSRLGITPVNGIPAGNGSWGKQVTAAMEKEKSITRVFLCLLIILIESWLITYIILSTLIMTFSTSLHRA